MWVWTKLVSQTSDFFIILYNSNELMQIWLSVTIHRELTHIIDRMHLHTQFFDQNYKKSLVWARLGRNYLPHSLLFLLFSKQQKCPFISLKILLTFPEHYIDYSKLLVAGPNFYTHLCCQWDNCEILISVVFGQRGANDSKLHVLVIL